MQSKEPFSQFEHKVSKRKLNGLIESNRLALLRRVPSTNAVGNHNVPNDVLACIDLSSSNSKV